MTRRELLRMAIALPAGAWISNFQAMAAGELKQVKITAIKALQLRNNGGNCLIKIETDAGLVGYGEAGASGPMARARIETVRQYLIGEDPLQIERHFHNLTNMRHYVPHIPTISGIDTALWDLAGQILGAPVVKLLGGPFRDKVRLYINTGPGNMQDPISCRDWAQKFKADPSGFTCAKLGVPFPRPGRNEAGPRLSADRVPMLTAADISRVARGFANVREAAGSDIDIIAHCHNEMNLPSAIEVARALEPAHVLMLEDPMPVQYTDAWATLKKSSRTLIETGEKLELAQFYTFMKNEAVDIIQPDVAFSGGITGMRKIAEYASLFHVPMSAHNVGTLVLTMATIHWAASIYDFIASENVITQNPIVVKMAASNPPVVKGGFAEVPMRPGLGIDMNHEALKENMAPGEPWWG